MRVKRLIWLVLLAAVAITVVLWWRNKQSATLPVQVHRVSAGLVEAVVANTRAGTVEALRRSKLAPQTGGQVHKLLVREGNRVEADQVLMELWNEDLRAQIALAESELLRAKALGDHARLIAELAERDSQRIQELKQAEISSEELTDRRIVEAKAKQAELVAARAAEAVAADRLTTVKAALERTILRAPFAGIVAEVNAELGEYVTPSPPGIPTLPAIDLIDTSAMFVKAPIDEVDSAAVQVGQEARISLDAFPGMHFRGQVTRKAPYVLDREKEARTVDIEVEFSNRAELDRAVPGATADVEIVLQRAQDRLRIPTEALLEGQKVLLYQEHDPILIERRVEIGIRNWQFAEVTAGLNAGDTIVLSIDREGVKAGARVHAEPLPAQASEGKSAPR